ncbi:MAG: electron transfer flavoprotein subunit alpha/FixB family protein [Melioribacteraceae bacterium]|nr:electron transfer flavoprotein subunit alpha/FixB family protein [Melioribacteraceae bacterium]
MANKILVVLEQRDKQLKKISFEAAKAGSDLAKDLGCEITSVVVGDEIADLAQIGGYGVKEVAHVKNSDLANYSSSDYAKAIAEHANEVGADILIVGNTALGKDLAPKLSVKLDAGIAMDCVELKISENEIIATRPIYAGKALLDVKISSDKKIFTLRPNVFNPGEATADTAEVVEKSFDAELPVKVIDIKKNEGKLDVSEASIIVSGGRGLKEPENFKLVEELADEFGAAVGASRAVVDAGWRPHAEQVGQTGKTVSPNLYVALGISGAIQHLAGMRSSKYIVAINKDPDAPIFQVADYGIAGDVFEVVPALIEELKK